LYKNLLNKKPLKLKKDLITSFENINLLFELLYEGFYKKDIAVLDKIYLKRTALQENLFDLFAAKGKSESVFIHYCLDLLRNIQMTSTFVFGFVFEH